MRLRRTIRRNLQPPRNLRLKRAAEKRAERELAEKERAEQAAAEKKLEQAWNSPPPPVQLTPGQKPRSPFEDPVERRRRHQIRLQQLREARANGRMHHFHFYADDGPMP